MSTRGVSGRTDSFDLLADKVKIELSVLAVVSAFGLGWYFGSRPPKVPPKPPVPTKADTVYVVLPSIPEIVQERVFVPGPDVPVPAPYEVEIFLPDTVRCEEVEPRTRIMNASFGTQYGDTTSVSLESMSFEGGSLVFRSKIERLYSDGMPKRIWIDSGQTMIEWTEFPVIRVNSCSLGTKLMSGAVGCGACTVLDLIWGN